MLPLCKLRFGQKKSQYEHDLYSKELAILDAIALQVKDPPKNDVGIRNFFQSILDLTEQIQFVSFVTEIEKRRLLSGKHPLTPSHWASLLLRAFQYLELRENKPYPMFLSDDYSKWNHEVEFVFTNETHRELLMQVISTKEIITNIPQRYGGINALLTLLYGDTPLSILDLGCSANHGLISIELTTPENPLFAPVIDHTPNQQIAASVNQKRSIEEAIGVDQNFFDHTNPDSLLWLQACAHYPSEMRDLETYKKHVVAFSKQQHKTKTYRKSFLELRDDFTNLFNVIIFSSVFYQLSPTERKRAFVEVQHFLKPNGIILIQDTFNIKADGEIVFHSDIGGHEYPYKLVMIQPHKECAFKEMLQYKNNRCEEVKAGKDFESILKQKDSLFL